MYIDLKYRVMSYTLERGKGRAPHSRRRDDGVIYPAAIQADGVHGRQHSS